MIFLLSWRGLIVFVVVCFLSLLLWNIIGSSSYNSRISKDLLLAFCTVLVLFLFLLVVIFILCYTSTQYLDRTVPWRKGEGWVSLRDAAQHDMKHNNRQSYGPNAR